jgi:uncharacterized membrane protein YqjE
MLHPLAELTAVTEAGRRLIGLVLELLADRLELAGLELREAKIRLLEALGLALIGLALCLLALALAVVAVLLVLPPQWRPAAAAGAAGLCLLLGAWALRGLRRRLARRPLAFAQTIEELKKDRACF